MEDSKIENVKEKKKELDIECALCYKMMVCDKYKEYTTKTVYYFKCPHCNYEREIWSMR